MAGGHGQEAGCWVGVTQGAYSGPDTEQGRDACDGAAEPQAGTGGHPSWARELGGQILTGVDWTIKGTRAFTIIQVASWGVWNLHSFVEKKEEETVQVRAQLLQSLGPPPGGSAPPAKALPRFPRPTPRVHTRTCCSAPWEASPSHLPESRVSRGIDTPAGARPLLCPHPDLPIPHRGCMNFFL